MIAVLRQAATTFPDYPDAPPPTFEQPSDVPVRRQRGRPRKIVNPDALEAITSSSRATRDRVGQVFECSGRTIRRRLIEYGMSPAGPPVYETTQEPDGTYIQTFYPGSSADLSSLSDDELDALMQQIRTQFPSFGRRMIDGYLMQLGQRVPRRRINESFSRLFGPSNRRFAQRTIQRSTYSVPGPGSLWHHDGQHGMHSSYCRNFD